MTPDFFMYFLCLKLSTVSSKLRLQLIQILCFIYSYISDRIFYFVGTCAARYEPYYRWSLNPPPQGIIPYPGMKYFWLIILLLMTGCVGTFDLTPNGHRLLYKSQDGQISCYTNNCCYPYKERVMLCTEAGLDNVSFTLKYIPDK